VSSHAENPTFLQRYQIIVDTLQRTREALLSLGKDGVTSNTGRSLTKLGTQPEGLEGVDYEAKTWKYSNPWQNSTIQLPRILPQRSAEGNVLDS
jgi:hypothetical protein